MKGAHLAFPFSIGPDGRTAQVKSMADHVRDELLQFILTNPGERVFLPEFGAGVRRLVFETTDETTRGVTKARITHGLSQWLGHRITVEHLRVDFVGEKIEVEIQYRLAGTEDTRVLKFQRTVA